MTSQMKMYHFKSNSYDLEPVVLAESLQDAETYLKLSAESASNDGHYDSKTQSCYCDRCFRTRKVSEILSSQQYTVVEYSTGEVLWTEVS